MADEILNEVIPEDTGTETTPETEVVTEAPQPTKWESQAREEGWVPLNEWDGDPEDWTDAKEFVRRGELFHKISNQSSEIKELKKAITGLMDHHQKVKETEFSRALDYLKQQKKAALEEGDADKLLAVDEAIDVLKEERQVEKTTAVERKEAGPTPVFVDWVKQNPWYTKDPELREFADDVGTGIFQRRRGQIAEAELYKIVKDRVMKQFPDKFKGQGTKTPTVEGTTQSARKTDPASSFQLSDDEKRVMNTFVRQGIMSKEQYIEELKRVKGA